MSLSKSKISLLRKISEGRSGNIKAAKIARLFQEAGATTRNDMYGIAAEFGDHSVLIPQQNRSREREKPTTNPEIKEFAKNLLAEVTR